MVSAEDIVIERLLTFNEIQSGQCLREILVVLNEMGHRLDYEFLEKEIDLRMLRKEWKIVKKIIFTSRLNY